MRLVFFALTPHVTAGDRVRFVVVFVVALEERFSLAKGRFATVLITYCRHARVVRSVHAVVDFGA